MCASAAPAVCGDGLRNWHSALASERKSSAPPSGRKSSLSCRTRSFCLRRKRLLPTLQDEKSRRRRWMHSKSAPMQMATSSSRSIATANWSLSSTARRTSRRARSARNGRLPARARSCLAWISAPSLSRRSSPKGRSTRFPCMKPAFATWSRCPAAAPIWIGWITAGTGWRNSRLSFCLETAMSPAAR